jgi:hypothetical protein
LCDGKRQIAFSGASGAGHCNQGEFRRVCNDERWGGEWIRMSHGMGCFEVISESRTRVLNPRYTI